LHAQFFSGGAAMSVLWGAPFCIWWRIPLSVATMYSSAASLIT
jgi:hypothetical protein